jgi:glucose 1-dehydrogenase
VRAAAPLGQPRRLRPCLLKGQTALVTGANSGIGKAIAIALGQAGAEVAVNYRSDEQAALGVVETIVRAGSRGLAADVSSEEQVIAMFRRTIEAFGTVDILVNNAGLQQDAPIEEMTLAQWNTVIGVNLTGQFLCARETIREFKRRGVVADVSVSAGKIICISPVHEVIPWGGHVNYAASKGGLMLMMKSIAQEVAPDRIRVNSICPGAVRTPIKTGAWATPEAYGLRRSKDEFDRGGRCAEAEAEERSSEIERRLIPLESLAADRDAHAHHDRRGPVPGPVAATAGGIAGRAKVAFVPSSLASGIPNPQQPDQDSVGGRNKGERCPRCLQVLRQLPGAHVRPKRDGVRPHDQLHAGVRSGISAPALDQAKDDTLIIHDDAYVRAALAQPIPHRPDGFVDPARRNVPLGDVGHPGRAGLRAFAGKARCEPVGLPRLIPVDLPEPERLEPRRGPCAHVSLVVMAIDDDGPCRIEPAYRFVTERLQRAADRAGNVLGRVFLCRKHVDELRPRADHLSDPVPVDLLRHRDLLSCAPDALPPVRFPWPLAGSAPVPGRCRSFCSLDRGTEPESIHGVHHVFDADLRRIERDDRLFRTKAHVRSTYTLQPFQGLLDRDGSGASRHPVHREHDGRRRRERNTRGERKEEEPENARRPRHRILPMSWPV